MLSLFFKLILNKMWLLVLIIIWDSKVILIKLFSVNYYLNNENIKGMTKITKEEVKKVAHLARLELNEDEINNHAEQLEKILEYIKQLEKIDTDDVPCTTRAIEVINSFRKDEKKNSDCNEDILELGPSREDNYFKVPKIINEWVSCYL